MWRHPEQAGYFVRVMWSHTSHPINEGGFGIEISASKS
jgi:hypothetical protein